MRQEAMKAELKLYVRTIITEQLALWDDDAGDQLDSSLDTYAKSDKNLLDESNVEIL